MRQVNIHTAKTHLCRLIAAACAGEDIVLSKGNVPMVRLSPLEPPSRGRVLGSHKGKARTDERFFEPLPREELDGWEQG